MLGFEVTFNSAVRKAALDNGVVTIVLTRVKNKNRDEITIDFGGLEAGTNQKTRWLTSNLKRDDTISVRVVDVEQNSAPESTKKLDPTETILEGKLRSYLALKRDLEEAGLI